MSTCRLNVYFRLLIQEVQWNDIDYMDKYLDWTHDKNRYGDLPQIVDDLHSHDQKYIIIVVSATLI